MAGRAFALVGPSGVGKDSLMAAVQAALPSVHLVRRVITRPEAAGGEPFEGVDQAEFDRRAEAGQFALHWRAHGLSYGIPTQARDVMAQGRDVLFNTSRTMLDEAARAFPGFRVIHVTARPEVLAARLAARGREAPADRARRLARADLALPPGMDVTVIDNSGPLEAATRALIEALKPVRA